MSCCDLRPQECYINVVTIKLGFIKGKGDIMFSVGFVGFPSLDLRGNFSSFLNFSLFIPACFLSD